jgi:hypothetical protein
LIVGEHNAMYVHAMTNLKDIMLSAEFNITVEPTQSGPQPSLWARLPVPPPCPGATVRDVLEFLAGLVEIAMVFGEEFPVDIEVRTPTEGRVFLPLSPAEVIPGLAALAEAIGGEFAM